MLEELLDELHVFYDVFCICFSFSIFFFQRINHKIITVGNLESAETAKLNDLEISTIVEKQYKRAIQILKKHKKTELKYLQFQASTVKNIEHILKHS